MLKKKQNKNIQEVCVQFFQVTEIIVIEKKYNLYLC